MLVLIVIGLAPVIIASSIIVRSYEDRAVSVRISNVKNQCDMLCNLVVSEGFLERPSSKLLDSELTLLPERERLHSLRQPERFYRNHRTHHRRPLIGGEGRASRVHFHE